MRLSWLIFVVGLQSGLAQSPWYSRQPIQPTGCSAKLQGVAQSQPASAADPNVDAVYYRLDLRLNIPSSTLRGVITVRVRVVSDSTNALMLDLSESMILDSVRMNGQPLTTIRFPQSCR